MDKENHKPTQEEIDDNFNYSESTGGLSSLTIKDMVCWDCKFATKSISSCKKYEVKPSTAYYTYCVGYVKKNDGILDFARHMHYVCNTMSRMFVGGFKK